MNLCYNDDVVLGQPNEFYFTVTVSIHIGEEVDVNFAEWMPFYSLWDYDIENESLTTKRKFESLLDKKQFEIFLKENTYEQIFNPTCVTPYQYWLIKMNLLTKIEREKNCSMFSP